MTSADPIAQAEEKARAKASAAKELKAALTVAGGILLLALACTAAKQFGLIDQDMVTRVLIGANGLMIAWMGNRAPKALAPTACAAKLARFSGWSLVLSGLINTGFWIFAPIDTAVVWGTGVIFAGCAATLIYGLRLRARAKAAKRVA